MQEHYKVLAVLLEDMLAPPPILQTLWCVSEAEAHRVAKLFVDRSLVQLDDEVKASASTISNSITSVPNSRTTKRWT